MVVHTGADAEIRSSAEHARHLRALLSERGFAEYGLFWVNGEGTISPDGYEESSGYVIDKTGQTYFFWVGWSEHEQRSMFETWTPAKPEDSWADNAEYQRARMAAGVTA